MNKKFVIIDAMAIAYRAYFAFINSPLVTKKGEPTSAVYGFLSQLIKIFSDNKPDYIAVAFDSQERTFRHDKYEGYKSSRAKMPDDMMPQLERIKQLIDVMNIPIYIIPGYEADDIIGTAACKAEDYGLETYIITPDKDFTQLINDKVKVIKPGGKSGDEIVVYDTARVKEEFGFEPKQMIDYLALIGDSSDDIPGVAGVGPKTAIPLIQKYGTIENLYKHIDEIDKPALKNKLVIGQTNAFISKDLATIHCEVPLEFDFEKAKFQKPDFEALRKIIVELEFKDIYNRMLAIYDTNGADAKLTETVDEEIEQFDKSKVTYKQIKTLKEAEELAEYLNSKELFVFDTETDSLDHYKLFLAGVSFSTKEKEGFFIALKPDEGYEGEISNPDERFTKEEFKRIFQKVFENEKIKKVCQNAKFDIGCMVNLGIKVKNFYFDTMLASYVLDPDQKHGLNDLSVKYLKYKPIPISELLGPKPDPSAIFKVDCGPLCQYASEDADITYRLYKILDKELHKENLTKIAYEIEFPLIPVLEDMERTGVNIDVDALHSLSDDLQKKLNEYTEEIYKCCGVEFNINSTKQLQEVLFTKLGLKSGRKTKTGFSTDARSLENLRGQHEVIDLLLEYRVVSKLKSTYADALPNLINPKTGRIHTSFNQTVASTGRLSSNDPNLQNIPIRTELGKEIRRAFVPKDKNHVILSADYSQIELRIMAHISGDENLSKAFKENEDIHRSTAALVFMVKPEDVTPDMRRKAKEVNFGILYGIGPFGLKTRLGVTQTHAKEIIDTYFKTFKRVKDFMDDSILRAKEKGFAETIYGRRRFLRNINSSNRVVRQFEERVAINMRVQGTAADMIKLAMINIHKELERRKMKTKMVLQVHDELVFDAHKDELDEIRPLIKELMENALPLNVPVVVDTGIGDNWLDAH